MPVAGLAYGAFANPRRSSPVALEDCPAIRITDSDRPADLEVVVLSPVAALQRECFRCPHCGGLARALFDPEGRERWRCRGCWKLSNRSAHEGTDPLARATYLRRSIGASLALASPLPPRPTDPREARKFDKVAIEIMASEARALKVVRRMLDGLDRYATNRGEAAMTPLALQDEEIGERVFRYRLDEGASERACARHFGITTQEVRRYTMERAPSIDPEARSLEVSLELERINRTAKRFYRWVMETDEPNVACACASILIRLSERKGAILGFDHAPRRADQLTFVEATPRTDSTQRIRAVIDAIVRERPPRPLTAADVLGAPANGGDPDDISGLPPRPAS